MSSATDFSQQVDSVGIDGINLSISTLPEAKEALLRFRSAERALRLIKRSVNAQQTSIRSDYQARKANAGSGGSVVFQLFGKRGAAGQYRAAAKRDLQNERDRVLAPYGDVKLRIDKILLQTADAKSQLVEFIAQLKAGSEPAITKTKTMTGAKFCVKCGGKVSSSDRFCRDCGASQSKK